MGSPFKSLLSQLFRCGERDHAIAVILYMRDGSKRMNGHMDCLGETVEVKVGTLPSFASEV